MLASELIDKLKKHPDYLIQIGTSDIIGPVRDVYTDCFDEQDGMCFVIEVNDD
jgi:NAD-dependent SIR2 family protein deacetylase